MVEGQKSKITVVGENLPSGLTYQWRVTDGICDPQKSSLGETVFEAPNIEDSTGEEKVEIVAEFYQDGRKRGDGSLTLTIKQRDDSPATPSSTQTPKTTAELPGTPSHTPPRIEITKAGRLDLQGGQFWGDSIEGRVSGVDPKDYRVILYTLSSGNWHIQPYQEGDARFTEIDQNSVFTNTYHTGLKYAAILARRSFQDPPAKTITLPLNKENVVAFTIVDGVQK
jgi:hypothetical protein